MNANTSVSQNVVTVSPVDHSFGTLDNRAFASEDEEMAEPQDYPLPPNYPSIIYPAIAIMPGSTIPLVQDVNFIEVDPELRASESSRTASGEGSEIEERNEDEEANEGENEDEDEDEDEDASSEVSAGNDLMVWHFLSPFMLCFSQEVILIGKTLNMPSVVTSNSKEAITMGPLHQTPQNLAWISKAWDQSASLLVRAMLNRSLNFLRKLHSDIVTTRSSIKKHAILGKSNLRELNLTIRPGRNSLKLPQLTPSGMLLELLRFLILPDVNCTNYHYTKRDHSKSV
jgi:hypothetical protein